MIVAVDFDGTIARSDYPVILGEMPYAKEVLKELKANGHYIIIWTCRTGRALIDAVNWMLEHEISFDRINDGQPENVALYGGEGRKVYAHCYVDDKNVGGFPGWLEVKRLIVEEELKFLSKV